MSKGEFGELSTCNDCGCDEGEHFRITVRLYGGSFHEDDVPIREAAACVPRSLCRKCVGKREEAGRQAAAAKAEGGSEG